MISSDDSSSDDGGIKDSRSFRNHTSFAKTGGEQSITELHGKKKKIEVLKTNKLQNVCGTVENDRTDRKKMSKSDFIKSNSDDSDNRLDFSPMKKQKLKKRKLSSSCFPNKVHSPVKRNKSNDVCIDDSCSSSEDNKPSTSQRKKKRRKIKDKSSPSTEDHSDECVDKRTRKTCRIDESDISKETPLGSEEDLDDISSDDDFKDGEFATIKKELSEMSFEDRAKLRDRLGIKVYNKVVHGERKQSPEKKMQKTFKRENKNRPMEISSKKRSSVFRNAIPVKKKIIRDPRFDDLSGEYNEHLFKQSYGFIDDIKAKEKQKLEKQLNKEKNEKKKEGINYLLNRMKQEELSEKKKKERHGLEKQWKKKEMQMVHEGKTPFFLKKGDLKKLELAEKYKELQKSGKLDNYLTKKRKKNASKEKKKLPT